MTEATRQRLFSPTGAFDHPVTVGIVLFILLALILAPIAIVTANRVRDIASSMRRELWLRYFTWLALTLLIVGPVLLGAAWTMLAVTGLSFCCYFEFARKTPIANQYTIHSVAVLGVLTINFGALDHWWELFSATTCRSSTGSRRLVRSASSSR